MTRSCCRTIVNTTCTRTVGTNTRAAFVADITCTGARPMKGQVNIHALAGGAAFKGAVKMETSAGGRTTNLAMTMTGKYLGPDCGSVK